MPKFFKYAAFALSVALLTSPLYAEDKPVAVVNGVTIPQARLEMRVKSAASQGQPDNPELRKTARDELISVELMSQEAVKKGLDKQPETMTKLDLARQSVLVGAFVQDHYATHPITDEALQQEYETLKLATGSREYKARHILVKEEAQAKSIAAQLKKGGKFNKLASKHSLDPGSKDKGGELDWSMPGNFVPQFSNAMVSLKKGEVSDPVKSDFGWHIIKLDDVRDFNFPPLQEVKPELTQRLQQQSVMKAVEELRGKAKIE